MALPYFYIDNLSEKNGTQVLDEDTSKHITQVLRMKRDESVLLTDGKGSKAEAIIIDDNRKRCEVRITSIELEKVRLPKVTVAISLVKNSSRFEWFLEKATEIGISEIIPLICGRTEKEKFRFDRMNSILISAMLQSQQCWLPVLKEPASFEKVVNEAVAERKYIAHCLPHKRLSLAQSSAEEQSDSLILIGPEGDFTEGEIELALKAGFKAVTLGETRLRTETAGVVAAVLLRIHA